MFMMSCTRGSHLYNGVSYAGKTSSSYVNDWQLNRNGNIYSKLTSVIIYLDQWVQWYPVTFCIISYCFETQLKELSWNLFVHNINLSCPIILKFCTKHGSGTAMLCAKFRNDWATEKYLMGIQDFTRFELRWVSELYSTLQQHSAPRDGFHNGIAKFSIQTSSMGLWWIWTDLRKQYKLLRRKY